MAVPTVASVSPSRGHTGGCLVRITGTNFREPTEPSNPSGPLPEAAPSVEVFFGAEQATTVRWLSSTLLEVIAPGQDKGTVSVIVRNVDDDGELIGAETAELEDAFEFAQPDLTVDQYPTRVIDQLILEMRRQILDEVVTLTHTDYDATPEDDLQITQLAKIPALILLGPELLDAPEIPANSEVEIDDGTETDTIDVYQRAEVKHLRFRLIGVTDNSRELFNLLSVTRLFFKKNPYVVVARDPEDADQGRNRHPVFVETEPAARGAPTTSNLRQFTASFALHGVYFERIDGFEKDGLVRKTAPAETVELEPSVVYVPIE